MISFIIKCLPLILIINIALIMHICGKYGDLFRSIANTWIIMTVLSWISVEGLGALHIWTRKTVLAFWILISIVLLGYIIRESKKNGWKFAIANSIAEEWKKHKIIYTGLILYFLIMIVFASIRQQSNIDSMVYHLPRIMHWIQNKSVGYYPTGEMRQITYPALSEYLVGQIMILGGCDRQANLVQTVSYICSGLMVYAIGRRLGTKKVAAFASMCIYYCTPMMIAQAFSTQTDDIACMFLLVYIYLIIDYIQSRRLDLTTNGILATIRIATCVIMGYLCKPTIGFGIAVFAIWMLCAQLKNFSIKKWLIHIGVAIVVIVLIFAPKLIRAAEYQRDYKAYNEMIAVQQNESEVEVQKGHPKHYDTPTQAVAPDVETVKAGIVNPKLFASYAIRNIVRVSFSSYYDRLNEYMTNWVREVGDPNVQDHSRFEPQFGDGFWAEDTCSAPALMLFTLIMIALVLSRISRTDVAQTVFIICSLATFLLQCGLQGYTPFRGRYLVGAMALLCICVGIAISTINMDIKYLFSIAGATVAICLLGASMTFLIQADLAIKGLSCGRTHAYFLAYEPNAELYAPFVEIINARQFKKIGIEGACGFEYVFWATNDNLERLDTVNILGDYKMYEDETFIPECIVDSKYNPDKDGDSMECHGHSYSLMHVSELDGRYTALFEFEK